MSDLCAAGTAVDTENNPTLGGKEMQSRNLNAITGARGARRLLVLATAAIAIVVTACAPPVPPGSFDKALLQQVKRAEFGAQAQAEAARVAIGQAQPVVEFTVENSPPSVFVNWIIPDGQAPAFESFIGLPPGFSLAKVSILDSDPVPRYWFSLNVYRVSGITTGLRAEWSTYVDDGNGQPRFMIVRARAADGSIDPIGPLAPPEPFGHALGTDDVIRTDINKTVIQNDVPVVTGDNLFNSDIALPDPGDRVFVDPTREWVEANDYIYWMNGVADRTFQNATSHSAPLLSVDLADVTLADDSEWAPYLDPVPGHVLVYLDAIEFSIIPWWNVTEPDGLVDPATRADLLAFKNSLYSGYASTYALGVLTGNNEPIVQTTVENSPPSVDWHWRVPAGSLASFEAALGLPAGLTLAPVRLQDDDTAADYWLSLNVHRVSGASEGLRAEWTTYVDDGNGVRAYIAEARSDYPSLDPIGITNATYPRTSPYPVTHTFADPSVSTTVGTGPTAFSSSFDLPAPGPTALASRELVAANELRYWPNKVADRVAHDSTVFDPKISVDPATVALTDGGPWAAFVGATPDRVWVTDQSTGYVTNPWWNLDSL